jgi:hypothetical protein
MHVMYVQQNPNVTVRESSGPLPPHTDFGSTARAGQPSLASLHAPLQDGFEGKAVEVVKQQIRDIARDPEKFADLFAKAFGSSRDVRAADALRQRILAGDFSWLPRIRVVPHADLQGGDGAYHKDSSTVFLSAALRDNPVKAAAVLSEEIGHHIDTLVNKTDARGDEGEIFRLGLSGVQLTDAMVQEIRDRGEDRGVIRVGGKKLEVEFFFGKLFKKIGGFFGGVFNAVNAGIGKAVGFIGKIAKPVLGFLGKVAPLALPVLSAIFPPLGALGVALGGLLGKASAFLGGLLGKAAGFLGGLAGKLGGVVQPVISLASKLVGPFALPLQRAVQWSMDQLLGARQQAGAPYAAEYGACPGGLNPDMLQGLRLEDALRIAQQRGLEIEVVRAEEEATMDYRASRLRLFLGFDGRVTVALFG